MWSTLEDVDSFWLSVGGSESDLELSFFFLFWCCFVFPLSDLGIVVVVLILDHVANPLPFSFRVFNISMWS